MSYESLTSIETCNRLWILRDTNPQYYRGLKGKRTSEVEKIFAEEAVVENTEGGGHEDVDRDNSDLACGTIILSVLAPTLREGILSNESGGLLSGGQVDSLNEAPLATGVDGKVADTGAMSSRKQKKKPNTLYS